jgi:predicted DNA-binding protein
MRKVETSIRFSPGTLERLKYLAHLRSLETGRTVTWNGLVRDVVEKQLLDGDMQLNEERLPR